MDRLICLSLSLIISKWISRRFWGACVLSFSAHSTMMRAPGSLVSSSHQSSVEDSIFSCRYKSKWCSVRSPLCVINVVKVGLLICLGFIPNDSPAPLVNAVFPLPKSPYKHHIE